MTSLQPPSAIEKVAGSPATEAVMTLVGALSGSPLAAVLPVLSKSLASERQNDRVKAALSAIDQTLNEHADALRHLSDAQYKLVNEAVLAVLHTTSAEKLRYLRNTVANSLSMTDIQSQDAVTLGRTIRDISADEAAFLIQNFGFSRIFLSTVPDDQGPSALTVNATSAEGAIVSGLVSLGLLHSVSSNMSAHGMHSFSPVVPKLLALLRDAQA